VKPQHARQLLPRLQDILFITIFLSVLLVGQRMLNLDGDLPRHLLMGKTILQNRTIPTTELFIYPSQGQPYTPHEWLTDVIFAMIDSRWGLTGIVLGCAFLLATTFTLLYSSLSNRLNLRLPIMLLVIWGAMATSINWAARPHLVSMLLLAIWLIWADRLYRGEKVSLWRFPALMLLWTNLHGEFIAGILVLFAYAFGWLLEYRFDRSNTSLETGKKLWLVLVLSLAASLINPSGTGSWTTMAGFVNDRYLMSRMLEANSPNFQNPDLYVTLGLLCLSVFLLAVKKDRLSVGQGFLLAGFTALALTATRNVHLYAVVAPFVLAEAVLFVKSNHLVERFEAAFQNIEGGRKGIAWAGATFILIAIFMLRGEPQKFYQFSEPAFPVRAVQWLEQNPQSGRMFNDLNWGGYIANHLWPYQLTFVDSMADTTGQVTREYETLLTLKNGWRELLNKYQIQWAIVRTQSSIAQALQASGWKIIYADDTSVILKKNHNPQLLYHRVDHDRQEDENQVRTRPFVHAPGELIAAFFPDSPGSIKK
jgi:hypothetical protein